MVVRLGEHTKSTSPDCKEFVKGEIICADHVQDIPVTHEDLIVHESFNFRDVKHDIGLIRLSEPAKIHQNNIKPICLPFESPQIPRILLVIGFGMTESSGGENSDVLMKVRVEKKDSAECTFEKNTRIYEIDETQICAGGKNFKVFFTLN